MKEKILLYIILLWGIVGVMPAQAQASTKGFPHKWVPATVVSDSDVKQAGLERCFTAEPISDELFQRMQGKSWKRDCQMKRSGLRYLKLLHRNAEGRTQLGEMVVNEKIADKVVGVFRKLYEAGYRIERLVLVDDYDGDDERSMEANNTSSFNYRTVPGQKRMSKHAQGLAIDLNPRYNPYVTRRGISPKNGKEYANNRDRRKDIPYKIDHQDLAYRLFKAEGFSWGGDWSYSKDYQHFEF